MSWTAEREVLRAPAELEPRPPIVDTAPADTPLELSVVLPCLNEAVYRL